MRRLLLIPFLAALAWGQTSWVQGSGATLADFFPSVASSTLTIHAGEFRVGNYPYAIATGGIMFSAGTGDCKTFVSQAGVLTTWCVAAVGLTGNTPTGSMVLAIVTTPAYPAGSFPIADLTITGGVPSIDTDDRGFASVQPVVASAGILPTYNAGILTVALDATNTPTLAGVNAFTGENDFSASTKFRVRTGSGPPSGATCDEAAEVGGIYIRNDAGTTNASHYICSKTGASTYSWEMTGGSGAPTGAQYLTLANDAGLTAERLLNPRDGLTATDGGANGSYTIDNTADSSIAILQDEFCGGTTSSGRIGSLGWKTVAIGITGTLETNVHGASNHPCLLKINTSADTNGGLAVYLGPDFAYASYPDWHTAEFRAEFIFRFTAAPLTKIAHVGFFNMNSTNPTYRVGIRFYSATDTDWQFEQCNNGTCTTADSGVAAANTNWVRLVVYRNSGDTAAQFRLCLNACGSAVQLTTNGPNVGMNAGFVYTNDATGTNPQTMTPDWFGLKIRGLTRW